MDKNKTIRVLFVCSGNICRSPMAEAVFRHLVQQAGLSDKIDVESAGIGSWHVGQRPHPGTLAVLSQHQIGINGKRARQLTRSDLSEFDYVIAMDAENADDIRALFGKKVPRLLEFLPEADLQALPQAAALDVPDPYYNDKFDVVYDLVLAGGQALLAHIRQQEGL